MVRLASSLLGAALLLLALPAHGQDWQKGLDAYERGDYATALAEWRPLAEAGVPGAQINLGIMYRNGHGVNRDYAEAARWYRLAAERGHVVAQFNLGVLYADGEDAPRDDVRAHMWFDLAAAQGSDRAAEARDLVAARMTPATVAEAEGLAREWRKAHQ